MAQYQISLEASKVPGLEYYRKKHNDTHGTNLSNEQFLEYFINLWAGKGVRFSTVIAADGVRKRIAALSPANKTRVMKILDGRG